MPHPSPRIVCGTYRTLASALAERLEERLRESRPPADPFAAPFHEVLVPSRAFASAVASSLAERLGGSFAGVRFETVETFARRVVNAAGELPRPAGPDEREVAMRSAVGAGKFPHPRGTAAIADRAYRDLRDGGVTLRALRRKLPALPLPRRERLVPFVEAWERYERLVAGTGACDPADVLERAALLLREGRRHVIVAGFYDFTAAQRKVVEALLRSGQIDSFYFPVEMRGGGLEPSWAFAAATIEALRLDLSPAIVLPSPSPSAPRFEVHATCEEEMRSIARSVRRLLDSGVAPSRIGITARSFEARSLELLHDAAEEFGISLSPGRTVSLAATRAGRAVLRSLTVRGRGFPRADVIELAACGFRRSAAGIGIDPVALDRATREGEIAGGSGEALGRAISAAITRRPHLAAPLRDYETFVAKLDEWAPSSTTLPARGWSDLIRRLLDRLRLGTSRDLTAAEAIEAFADRLAASGAVAVAADQLTALLGRSPIAAAQGPDADAIWCGEVMKLRGRSFEYLFFAGADHESLPQRRSEDPVLRDSDRRAIGLREIGDGADEERLLFEIAKHSASREITLSCSLTGSGGKSRRPSPLVKQLAIDLHPAEASTIAGDFAGWAASAAHEPMSARERMLNDAAGEAFPTALHPTLARKLALLAGSGQGGVYDGKLSRGERLDRLVLPLLERISPSRLERYGECPQKFLLSTVYGADEIEDPDHEIGLDVRTRGSIEHAVLERFHRELTEEEIAGTAAHHELDPPAAARLAAIVDEELDRHDAEHPPLRPVMRAIERREMLRTLSAFATADLRELAGSGYRPRHLEFRFGEGGASAPAGEKVTITAGGVEMNLRGTIDRIDEGPDGWRVIDYKDGKGARHEGIRTKLADGQALQLPLYAMAFSELRGIDPGEIRGIIRPLARGMEKESSFTFRLSEEIDALRETLDDFVESMLDGEFPPVPGEEVCRYCVAALWCRTRHDRNEKFAAQRAGSPLEMLRSGR
jgi:hypothetical protein